MAILLFSTAPHSRAHHALTALLSPAEASFGKLYTGLLTKSFRWKCAPPPLIAATPVLGALIRSDRTIDSSAIRRIESAVGSYLIRVDTPIHRPKAVQGHACNMSNSEGAPGSEWACLIMSASKRNSGRARRYIPRTAARGQCIAVDEFERSDDAADSSSV